MRRTMIFALTALSAVLLFGCTEPVEPEEKEEDAGAPAAPAAAPATPAGGGVAREKETDREAQPRIADFTARDLTGREHKLSDLRAGKVLVLKLGTTWCPWCVKQAKVLDAFAKDHIGKPVAVVDVFLQEDAEKVRRHLDGKEPAYTVLADPGSTVAELLRVSGIPVVIVADREGRVAYSGHYTEREKLDGLVKELLQ